MTIPGHLRHGIDHKMLKQGDFTHVAAATIVPI